MLLEIIKKKCLKTNQLLCEDDEVASNKWSGWPGVWAQFKHMKTITRQEPVGNDKIKRKWEVAAVKYPRVHHITLSKIQNNTRACLEYMDARDQL